MATWNHLDRLDQDQVVCALFDRSRALVLLALGIRPVATASFVLLRDVLDLHVWAGLLVVGFLEHLEWKLLDNSFFRELGPVPLQRCRGVPIVGPELPLGQLAEPLGMGGHLRADQQVTLSWLVLAEWAVVSRWTFAVYATDVVRLVALLVVILLLIWSYLVLVPLLARVGADGLVVVLGHAVVSERDDLFFLLFWASLVGDLPEVVEDHLSLGGTWLFEVLDALLLGFALVGFDLGFGFLVDRFDHLLLEVQFGNFCCWDEGWLANL